jgi:hypothetical protein
MVNQLLFETPWWLLTLIAIVAIALLVSGNNRQKNRLKVAGFIVLSLGIILAAVSFFVDTPREKALKGTREFVRAVVDRDQAKLRSLLHPNASLLGWNKEDIVYGAKQYADDFGLKDAMITHLDADQSDTLVTVNLSVISTHTGGKMPYDNMNTSWQINWLDTGNGWLMKDIRLVQMGNMDTQGLKGIEQRYFNKTSHK